MNRMNRFGAICIAIALSGGATIGAAQPPDAGKYDLWDLQPATGTRDASGQVVDWTVIKSSAVDLAALGMFRQADDEDHDSDRVKLEDTPKLTVRGEAEFERPADQVRINVGVVTEGAEAGAALKENSRLMSNVVKALEKAGLREDEYETGRFRVRPNYSRRPRQAEPDWQPQIIGYNVLNSVSVKTKRLELAGDIIEKANAAGANTVEVVGFDLADPRTYRAEAIATATKNAIADAKALAEAASLDLVRIVAINLDHTPLRTPDMGYASRGRAMADAGIAPPINPGEVTISAGVTIVYEIASKRPEP